MMSACTSLTLSFLSVIFFGLLPIKKPSAKLRNRVREYVLDANDSAVLCIEFKNGALGTIHTTRWAGGHINRLYLKISGTMGSVEIDSERTTDGYRISTGKDLDQGLWKDVVTTPEAQHLSTFHQIHPDRQTRPA